MANILVVDDDEPIRSIIATALEKAGHKVVKAASGDDAMRLLNEDIYDIILADLNMPQPGGISVLRAAKNVTPDVEVIMMTGYSTIETAIEAMKLGAWSYVVKPISLQQLLLIINRALENRQLVASLRHLRAQVTEEYRFENILVRSQEMLRALKLAEKASTTDSPVLITGESGTGKQLIGMTIHTTSARGREPFISVNLSPVDQESMEMMLFGSVGGAATGAKAGARGAIERADRGTVFLEEITAAPPRVQERLLEFLEYSTVSRAGSEEMIYVDVRSIATSSVDVEKCVRRGEFRDDLFHLIGGTSMHLPPLAERRDDIPLLVNRFVSKYSKQFGKQIHGVSQKSLSLLMSYNWPGNVRELKNAIERAVVLTSEEVISPSSLPYPLQVSRA